jgi:hypothetical protein
MKILTLFILLFVISCNGIFNIKSENEKFIQGKWQLSGNLPGDRNFSWLLEWEFNNGTFFQSGYPPIRQEGKYKIIEEREDTIRLKLYKQTGTWGEQDSELDIIIDKENNTLSIQGKANFKRLNEDNI